MKAHTDGVDEANQTLLKNANGGVVDFADAFVSLGTVLSNITMAFNAI
jgi:hypothetical protein